MTPEKCPHCGMTWAEWRGEYECGSYPAGSSVVRATACTEIESLRTEIAERDAANKKDSELAVSLYQENAELQAQLAQAERVVVPELLSSEIEAYYLESVHAIPADIDAKEREWCFKDCRWAYNLAASRSHSVPASRVLKDGEVAIPEKSFRDLQHFHEIRDAAIHAVAHGLSNGPFRTKSLLMLRDALRAQGKEGAT